MPLEHHGASIAALVAKPHAIVTGGDEVGDSTVAAVKWFQIHRGLGVDRLVGGETCGVLGA